MKLKDNNMSLTYEMHTTQEHTSHDIPRDLGSLNGIMKSFGGHTAFCLLGHTDTSGCMEIYNHKANKAVLHML